ncbi:MAG TPA: carbohydrate ABC transporter permease [Rectinemataceae bacterium]|nr:carbohydrate ABC transporter permease [Rectinemataceae bacterium]
MKTASPFSPAARLAVQAFMLILVVASLLPLYNVISASLKSIDEYPTNPLLLPHAPTPENYQYAAFSGRLLRFTLNSLIYVPIGVVVYVVVCVMAGYAFGKMRFALRRPLFLMVLFMSIFPQLLLAMQVSRLISLLHLTNTGLGVILAWVAYFAPFGTYIMTTYFTDMPYELVEAARIDGASQYRILWSVMAPMAMPMVATIAIIGFQSMWNELPFSMLILQKESMRTVTVGIAVMRGQYGLRVPILSAALVMAMAVPIVFFLIFQRRITLGATAGAIKG